jgi:hypothetical protein
VTPGVPRARRPIDGHIAEQFEIMGDDRSFSAGHPALGNANYERIGILTAKIGTSRLEKWMPLVGRLCGFPRIFARRSPFGVTQPFPKWFAGGEMFKVGLRSGPDVRWAVWRQAENIPETAQQHVPHAKTPPQAVNKEALQDGGGTAVEVIAPTAPLSTSSWDKGSHSEGYARDLDDDDGGAARHQSCPYFENLFQHSR